MWMGGKVGEWRDHVEMSWVDSLVDCRWIGVEIDGYMDRPVYRWVDG